MNLCIICFEYKDNGINCYECNNYVCRYCMLIEKDDYCLAEMVLTLIENKYGYCGYLIIQYDQDRLDNTNWNWLYFRWFCTTNCMINCVISNNEDSFASPNKPHGINDLCNEQHNIWQRIVVNKSNVLIGDLLNIVCEYAQK